MPSWLDVITTDNLHSVNGRMETIESSYSAGPDSFALLDTQSILCAKGEGAVKFLQGQCTADLSQLKPGEATLGAICTNKGRVICNFRALKTEDSILLRMSSDLVDATLGYLKKYAVFFKVEIQAWNSACVAVVFNGSSISTKQLPDHVFYTDAEASSMELYAAPGSANKLFEYLSSDLELRSESDWYAQQIRAGQFSINICTTEKYLPHQLNLDKSGAVSFTKGCYTGQEIVARTEYKGKTKRRIFPVQIDADLGDLHTLEIYTDGDPKQELDLLVAAKQGPQTLAALLLSVEFPAKGNLLIGAKAVGYELIPMPYSVLD